MNFTVMITTECKDKDSSRHYYIVRELNHKLGIDESGANGGHGYYWTNAENVYSLDNANEYLRSFIEKPLDSNKWLRYGYAYVGIDIEILH